MPTDDVENTNSRNKGRDLFLANKPRIVSWRTEKNAVEDPEAQENYSTLISTSSTIARRKNLTMAWIDYKKAYDMVPQSSMINCLKMYKIVDKFIDFIEKTMKSRKVELLAGGKNLAETKIKRGIFQGDALSPLLFIIAMMSLIDSENVQPDINFLNRRKI